MKTDNNQSFRLASAILLVTLLGFAFVSIPQAYCADGYTVGLWHLDEVQPADYMEITPDATGYNHGTLGGEKHPTLVEENLEKH